MAESACKWDILPYWPSAVRIILHQTILLLFACIPFYASIDELSGIPCHTQLSISRTREISSATTSMKHGSRHTKLHPLIICEVRFTIGEVLYDGRETDELLMRGLFVHLTISRMDLTV
eukprot:scaffold541_cov23-Cyclotella_meneghiniana.AAC.1